MKNTDAERCVSLEANLKTARAENERLQAIVDRYEPPPGKCEHGVEDGEYCEPCNREYKRAAAEFQNEKNI